MPTSAKRAITPQNLLNKLSFVATGVGARDSDIKQRLLAYRADVLSPPSRQAVAKWFEEPGPVPSRANAFRFLRSFLLEAVKYSELLADQKKVHNQLVKFFSSRLDREDVRDSESPGGFVLSGLDGVQIKSKFDDSSLTEFSAVWAGWYRVYRYRLRRNVSKPFACEVIRLEVVGSHAAYSHWHRRGGVSVSCFKGGVHLGGQTIWFIGASPLENRIRVCHFKRVNMQNPEKLPFRWGLMHSDMPHSASYEPATTRILLERLPSQPLPVDQDLDAMVQYSEISGLPNHLQPYIERLLSNKTSCLSNASTLDILDVDDHSLRVDQSTIQMFCDEME